MVKRTQPGILGALVAIGLAACAPIQAPAQPIPPTFTALPSPTALTEPAGSTPEPAPTFTPEPTAAPEQPQAATPTTAAAEPAGDAIQHLIPGDRVSLRAIDMPEQSVRCTAKVFRRRAGRNDVEVPIDLTRIRIYQRDRQ